ncbi:MAG: hypothetical protein IKS51_08535 [Erysipelotrichaceae bacterium]|nr:hypothetical protein [Erysipelotrichaceae bacterium]
MAFRKTLYEVQKGKQTHASGTWKATKTEDLIVKVTAVFFTVSVVMELIAAFFHIRSLILPVTICLVLSFIGLFVVMFGIVYLKSGKEPMEKHYYDVDYKYDGIKGEISDSTKEITKEEFYGNKKD